MSIYGPIAKPKNRSYNNPQKKPTSIPSLRPLINPKDTVSISIRFGTTPDTSIKGNNADCNIKHIIINNPKVIIRINLLTFYYSITVFFVSNITNTSCMPEKSAAGVIYAVLVRLFESYLTSVTYPMVIPGRYLFETYDVTI